MAHANSNDSRPALKPFAVPATLQTLSLALLAIGALTFVAGVLMHNERVWTAYLVSFFFFTSLALGGLFFTAIHFVTNAGWSVNIRRIPEAFTAYLPIAAVTALGLFFGGKHLYVWLDAKEVAEDAVLASKTAYLSGGFWLIRLVVFFALWLYFARSIVGNSIAQDQSGDHALTQKNLKLGVAFLLIFAISYSLFSVDSMMSLQPHWFSTIFGVYCFAGLFQSTLALMVLFTVWMLKRGSLQGYVTDHHLHDLGKYLFAFTVFYAYIAFSQFMLIWYANLPEETEFYWNRMYGGWLWVSIGIAVFKFIVPFLALLPRWAKRCPSHISAVAVLVLVMQYVDIYWLVYPNFNENALVFSYWEVLIFLGFLGSFLWIVTRFWSSNNLVPIKDPRLHESMHHEVIY